MKRASLAYLGALALTLVLPSGTLATETQLGVVPTTQAAMTAPSCPGTPCLAVSRTTGFQAKVGTLRGPFVVPRDGRIVAWSIALGNPTKQQSQYFDTQEGGAASAGIAVLKSSPKLNYTLVAASPVQPLTAYFGQTVQFPLDQSIPVTKGELVALSVPTWAPALALGFGNDTSWRASRSRKQCTTTNSQTVHATTGSTVQYYCLYRTARLTYSATLISTP